jgi:hypothetical protein
MIGLLSWKTAHYNLKFPVFLRPLFLAKHARIECYKNSQFLTNSRLESVTFLLTFPRCLWFNVSVTVSVMVVVP